MANWKKYGVIISLFVLIAGCSSSPQQVPVSTAGQQPKPTTKPAAAPVPESAPATTQSIAPSTRPQYAASNSAVDSLLAKSNNAKDKGRYPEAEAYIERAIAIAPTNPAPYADLAQLKYSLGDLASAKQWVYKALSLQPSWSLRRSLQSLLKKL